MSDDRAAIICGLRKKLPRSPVPSLKMQCFKCGEGVWLSRAVAAEIKQKHGEFDAVCTKCAPVLGAKDVRLPMAAMKEFFEWHAKQASAGSN